MIIGIFFISLIFFDLFWYSDILYDILSDIFRNL